MPTPFRYLSVTNVILSKSAGLVASIAPLAFTGKLFKSCVMWFNHESTLKEISFSLSYKLKSYFKIINRFKIVKFKTQLINCVQRAFSKAIGIHEKQLKQISKSKSNLTCMVIDMMAITTRPTVAKRSNKKCHRFFLPSTTQ